MTWIHLTAIAVPDNVISKALHVNKVTDQRIKLLDGRHMSTLG